MPLSVLILGSGSALPTISSNQSSQIITCGNQLYLMDCGEGTQIELRRNKVKIQSINQIFISHLHGDHFFGLVGLLSTMHLLGRKNELNIYGPKGLEEIVLIQFRNAGSHLSFSMNFHEVTEGGKVIFEDEKIQISSIPLKHRIACYGYIFKEKLGLRKLKGLALKDYEIPIHARKGITEGEDFVLEDGTIVKNEVLTDQPAPTTSYAYCSDTSHFMKLVPFIKGVDLLYHEATFLEKDKERAKKTFHSTAREAAEIAKAADVGKLILGHFSNRYKTKDGFLEESRAVFGESYLAEEGKLYTV